uniref:Uncharacterized protein n=1 Tax=Tetradesmus obliquus TaxID=3088 RepID=A0A383V5V4_TETOB|eukprot:jgi/Sobl393_1/6213/SZX59954.1
MPSVDEDAWYVLLSFGQLSSDSFIRLSWVSGQLRRLCKQIAADTSAAQALLLQAISAASAQLEPVNAPAAFESNNAAIPNLCFEQKLAWLKKQAPKFLQDGRVMAAALQQHNMPRPVATALLRHGAQLTWQQLQDAARRLVPGLQVWVELSRELQLPLHASVPHIAAAICCGEELGLQSPQQWGLPADASPAALSSRRLELLPGLAQLAVALPRDGGATPALQSLCSLQEAQGLASSTVAGLLKAALQMGASERVKVLMRLPAVPVRCGSSRNVSCLCQLPAAAGVSSEDAAVLLHAAVDSSSTAMVAELVQLQGVQALSFDTTLSLLQASMHSSEPQLPAALAAGLPAALLQQLQPVNVVKLMQAALTAEQQQGALQQVQAALGLPAAQVPDADSVCSLLQQAVRHPEEGLVAALCGLPGAQLMDAQSICSLLAGALESGGYQKVQALVRLPAAQSSTADALMPLASAAARTSEQQSLLALLWLPAAKQQVLTAWHVGPPSAQLCSHRAAACGLCRQVQCSSRNDSSSRNGRTQDVASVAPDRSRHNTRTAAAAAAAAVAAAAAAAASPLHGEQASTAAAEAATTADKACAAATDACVAALPLLTVLCQLPAAQQLPAAFMQQLLPSLAGLLCQQTQQLKEDTTSLRQALRSAGIHRESLSYKQYSAFDKLPNTVKGMLAWAQLLQQPLFLRAGEEAALELEAQHLLLLKAAVADAQVQLGVLDPKFFCKVWTCNKHGCSIMCLHSCKPSGRLSKSCYPS